MRARSGESTQQCRQPKRYKLALLTFVGLLAPVYFLPSALSAVLNGSRLLTVSVVVAGIVVLMTYVIMPVLTHFAAGWLFEQPKSDSRANVSKSIPE